MYYEFVIKLESFIKLTQNLNFSFKKSSLSSPTVWEVKFYQFYHGTILRLFPLSSSLLINLTFLGVKNRQTEVVRLIIDLLRQSM